MVYTVFKYIEKFARQNRAAVAAAATGEKMRAKKVYAQRSDVKRENEKQKRMSFICAMSPFHHRERMLTDFQPTLFHVHSVLGYSTS